MLRDSRTGKWRWKRLLAIGGLVFAVGGSAATYIGYRVLFAKNPQALREIQESEDRQDQLDDLFAAPSSDDKQQANGRRTP